MKTNNYEKSIIYSISKNIVERVSPEEISYFDTTWEVMKEYLSEWKEMPSEDWSIEKYQKEIKDGLEFLDEAEVSGLQTPKIIALVSLVWLQLTKAGGDIREELIEETIKNYGKALPDWLKPKMIGFIVPVIKKDLMELRKKAGEVEEEEEKKYMMYSHENRKGKPISENELEGYSEDKKDYFIWLDEKNRNLLIDKKSPSNVYPEERRALACLIKNMGKIVDYETLYPAIHGFREVLKEEWSKKYNELINDVHKCKSKLIEHCPEIRRFVITESGKGYKLELPKEIKYCLIEELIKKIA